MNKRVLVASATYDGMKRCKKQFLARIRELDYPDYDILLVENSNEDDFSKELSKEKKIKVIRYKNPKISNMQKVIDSRNKIINYFLKKDYTHLLMMDFDVIPPKDIIMELLKCEKDLVSGVYLNYFNIDKSIKVRPVVWMPISNKEFQKIKSKINLPKAAKSSYDLRRHLTLKEAESNKLIQVKFPSAGCLMISRRVLENKRVRYGIIDLEKKGFKGHTSDDIYFIEKARKAGFKPFCYTKVKCDHLVQETLRQNRL